MPQDTRRKRAPFLLARSYSLTMTDQGNSSNTPLFVLKLRGLSKDCRQMPMMSGLIRAAVPRVTRNTKSGSGTWFSPTVEPLSQRTLRQCPRQTGFAESNHFLRVSTYKIHRKNTTHLSALVLARS